MAGVVAEQELVEPNNARRGTIGVVALDSQGNLAAGTSTGGKGLSGLGASVTCYASWELRHCPCSCQLYWDWEDIIDECLAARIVVRVTDGLSLQEAMKRSTEAYQHQRDLGAIGIDSTGAISWGKTRKSPCRLHNGELMGDTLEAIVEDASNSAD